MAKYKVTIRIQSEIVFQLLARYAPFEIQEVEEIPDPTMPKAPPAVVAMANVIKARAKSKKRQQGAGANFAKGMNAVIMNIVDDGQTHSTAEFIRGLETSDYRATSVNSLVARLLKFNKITRVRPGFYRRSEDVSNTEKAERITRAVDQYDPEGIPET